MEFSFFTTENKSGYKTNEKWFSKNYPEEYSKIINYSFVKDKKMSFKEKIWFYFNNLKQRPTCKTCGDEIKFRERFDVPYGEFCKLKCFNENKTEMVKRQKITFNKKYGVDFYTQHSDFIKKQKETKLLKYGDENYNNVSKIKETKLLKYGDENYNNINKAVITLMSKYDVTNYSKSNNYRKKINNNFKLLYPDLNIIDINKNYVSIKCHECHECYELTKQLLYERSKRGYKVCTKCNPIGNTNRSGLEVSLTNFLSTLNIDYEVTNRKILGKEELDIYFPKNNLAIEFDGIYWHNELFVDKNYHLNKTIKCNEKNIDLIHIFEDEWLYKREIVKSIIKNKLGLTSNKIFARNCQIIEITSNESKKFLDDNHIQGNVNTKVRIGLIHNNELVSLMTFSKGRIIMGGKSDEWELTRFCNLLNTNVIGGANKLFKFFIKKYSPKKIISYSDIRLFNGGLYEKMGFKRVSQSKPNYWYVKNGLRSHRFNYRKSILVNDGFDPNKTEKEIMFERKIYRIYDCGNIRWEYQN